VKIHLYGVSKEEADASLKEHGTPKHCSNNACKPRMVRASALFLFKEPSAEWGQGIAAVSCCVSHAREMLRDMAP
jgi:hypothetical protein